ncbi:MAG: hypothetical protein U5K79_11875 [Cyclobacteriaceae bacterium]|nr:hypothetical protein [Cyclobacteriaceae bacterium]
MATGRHFILTTPAMWSGITFSDTWTPENTDAYFPAAHVSTNTKQNV